MWWEILKRQVASTKGKQFQLDFSQPMIEEEEEDCKKRFQAVQNKLRNLTIAGLKRKKKIILIILKFTLTIKRETNQDLAHMLKSF